MAGQVSARFLARCDRKDDIRQGLELADFVALYYPSQDQRKRLSISRSSGGTFACDFAPTNGIPAQQSGSY